MLSVLGAGPASALILPTADKRLQLEGSAEASTSLATTFTAGDKCSLVAGSRITTRTAGVDFWFSIWLRPLDVSGNKSLFHDGGSAVSLRGISLFLDDATPGVSFADGTTGASGYSTGTLTAGAVAQLLITAKRTGVGAGTLTFYINGAAAGTVDISALNDSDISSSGSYFPTVGALLSGTANWFGGDLSTIIYGEGSLPSPAQVTELYNLGNPLSYADMSDTLKALIGANGHFWPLNEQLIDLTHQARDLHNAVPMNLTFTRTNMVANPGFETAGAGGADVFANWDEAAGPGTIADEGAIVHAGSHAVKIIEVGSVSSYVTQGGVGFTKAGNRYDISAWCRSGSGSVGVNIGEGGQSAATGLTVDTTYAQKSRTFSSVSNGGIILYTDTSDGTIYFDDIECYANRLYPCAGFGAAYVSDSSASSPANHGKLVGYDDATLVSSFVPRGSGTALVFDGSNDHITLPTVNLGTVHTMHARIKGLLSNRVVFGDNAGASDFAYYVAGGNLQYVCGVDVGVPYTDDATVWRSISIVRDGASVAFYVDGVQSGDTQTLSQNNAFALGSVGAYVASNYYSGQLDDVRIYNVALTPAQVAELATIDEDTEPTGIVAANKVLHYKFEDAFQTPGQDDPIVIWISQDSTRHAFYQTTASQMPSYDLSVLNSLQGLYGDGLDDYMSGAAGVLSGEVTTLTVVGKCGASAFDADQVLIASSDTATDNFYFEIGFDVTGKFYVETKNNTTTNRVTGNTALSPGDDFVATLHTDGSEWTLTVNRVVQVPTVIGQNTGDMPADIAGLDNTTIFGKVNATGLVRPFEGWIVDVLDYTAAQTPAVVDRTHRIKMREYAIA